MDVYHQAKTFVALLQGRMAPTTLPDIVQSGRSEDAVRWRAAHGGLRRVHHGAYLTGAGEPDLLDTIRAALLVAVGPCATFTDRDLYGRPQDIVGTVVAARRAHCPRPPSVP